MIIIQMIPVLWFKDVSVCFSCDQQDQNDPLIYSSSICDYTLLLQNSDALIPVI